MSYENITTIIALFVAYIVMLYYCDTTMDFKYSRLASHCTVTVGYIIYCSITLMGIPSLNIISGIIINFLIIYLGYKNSIGRIIIRTIILTALAMFSDLVASLFINFQIDAEYQRIVPLLEDIVFTVMSKMIYFVSVVIFKNISANRNNSSRSYEMLWMLVLPISTCGYLAIFNQLYGSISKETEIIFIIIGVMLIVSNLIVYIVCEHIIEKNEEIRYLQNIQQKQEIDVLSYQLIKEKYNDLKIMVHDFNKYCNNIEMMLAKEQSEALSLIRDIKNTNKEFLLVEYTNNTALNILLSQKMKECNDEGIDFQLYVKDIDLSFIDEMDVISIFANLIDNAIESCKMSQEKKIFFSINIMNDSYIVIRADNSADKEPVEYGGRLLSVKSRRDKKIHGIGLISIRKALSKYGGNMNWSYNKKAKIFTNIIIMQPCLNTEIAVL